jgi:hypothetical protein
MGFFGSRRSYVLAALGWCAVALAIKPFFAYVDFGAFYATALDKILAGAPLDLYAFGAHVPGSPLVFPLTNPPIWLFYMSPWYAVGHLLGIADFHRQSGVSFGQAWMLVTSLPLDVLLCHSIVRLAEGRQQLAEPTRFLTFLCLLFSPLLWLSTVRFGHNESILVLMIVLAVAAGEKGRPLLSGLFFGLALGVKTTAIVPALVYFGWGCGRERRRDALAGAAVAAAVFALPMLPYVLFRREQIAYALLEFEGLRAVGGIVVWKLLPGLSSFATFSNGIILLSAAVIGLWLARRPGRSFLAAGGAWGLVLSQASLLFFGKALFVWYALPASCFLFLAILHARRFSGTIPMVAVVGSLLMWLLQGGAWVGESTDPLTLIRCALWAVLTFVLGLIAFFALRTAAGDAVDEPHPLGVAP